MSSNVLPIVEFFKTLLSEQDDSRNALSNILDQPSKVDEQEYLRSKSVSLDRAIDIIAQSNFIMENPPTDAEVYQQVINSYEAYTATLLHLSNSNAIRGAAESCEFVLTQARLALG